MLPDIVTRLYVASQKLYVLHKIHGLHPFSLTFRQAKAHGTNAPVRALKETEHMNEKKWKIREALVDALDPRTDSEDAVPRAFLYAKYGTEYLFKITGFFVLICLVVGMTLATCTQNVWLQLYPIILATAFFFYIAITTVGVPLFVALKKIENKLLRRILAYTTVIMVLTATFYSVNGSPIFELLDGYVVKLFPSAAECRDSLLELD